jgi:hypothetical protein
MSPLRASISRYPATVFSKSNLPLSTFSPRQPSGGDFYMARFRNRSPVTATTGLFLRAGVTQDGVAMGEAAKAFDDHLMAAGEIGEVLEGGLRRPARPPAPRTGSCCGLAALAIRRAPAAGRRRPVPAARGLVCPQSDKPFRQRARACGPECRWRCHRQTRNRAEIARVAWKLFEPEGLGLKQGQLTLMWLLPNGRLLVTLCHLLPEIRNPSGRHLPVAPARRDGLRAQGEFSTDMRNA